MQSCLDIDEIDAASKALDNPMVVETEVAHIFSESAQDGDKVSTLSLRYHPSYRSFHRIMPQRSSQYSRCLVLGIKRNPCMAAKLIAFIM